MGNKGERAKGKKEKSGNSKGFFTFLPSGLLAFAHRVYNRFISKRIIQNKIGGWFEVDWKKKAFQSDDKTWLRTYDESWNHWAEQDLSELDIQRIRALIPQGSSLLDAGCGDGYLLEKLKDKVDNAAGVDLSSVALKKAAERTGVNVRYVQSFLESMPFKTGSFDIVVCAHTLEHVRDLKKSVNELKRITAKILAVLVPVQEYRLYTEDYQLHFFREEQDLLELFNISGAECIKYSNSGADGKYTGEALLYIGRLKMDNL